MRITLASRRLLNLHSARCCDVRRLSWCWRRGCMYRGRSKRCSPSDGWSSRPSRWWRSRCKASPGSIRWSPVRNWRSSIGGLSSAAETCQSRWRACGRYAWRWAGCGRCTSRMPLGWCATGRGTPPSSSLAMQCRSSPKRRRPARPRGSPAALLWWSSSWTPNDRSLITAAFASCYNRGYLQRGEIARR